MKKKFNKLNKNDVDYYIPSEEKGDFYYLDNGDGKCSNFYPIDPLGHMDTIVDGVIADEVDHNKVVIDRLMEIESRARIEADAIMLEARRKQLNILMNTITASNCYNMKVMCEIVNDLAINKDKGNN